MTAYRAAWVLPIDRAPIKDGVVATKDGKVASVGSALAQSADVDLGNVALLPGLVNAHTHLELSWMRDRVPPASTFTGWVKTLFAIRGRPDGAMSADQIAPVHAADDAASIGQVELVLVCVKAHQTAAVLEPIATLLGPDTLIVPLQNGTEGDDLLAARFGRPRVAIAVVYVGATLEQRDSSATLPMG
jgi:cytosine/adenosine deaminase-related metal-dependent hydrolase